MSSFGLMATVMTITLVLLGFSHRFKQPSLIAYLITGVLISLLFPHLLWDAQDLQTFSSLGVSLLLFITGLGMSPEAIKEAGKKNLTGGIFQVVFTALGAFFLGKFLGMDQMTAAILAIGLASSSTIVMLKVFEEKKGMSRLKFAENALGISVSQDVLIMLLLMVILSVSTMREWWIGEVIGVLGLKMGVAFVSVRFSFKYLIPRIVKNIAKSQEFLMLFALGWCFLYGAWFEYLGFGMEIGSLLAGITLASSAYKSELIARIKSIKDFFIVIFFILLGANITLDIQINMSYLISFIVFIFLIKPLIVMLILGFQGSTKKDAFLSGLCFSHISEFSFIAVMFWISNGFITDPHLLGTLTVIALITIAASGYAIKYGNQLFHHFWSYLSFLPGKNTDHLLFDSRIGKQSHDILILGYSGMGKSFRKSFEQAGYRVLVVDRNPHIVEHLLSLGIDCRYGDMTNLSFLEALPLEQFKMIISTNKYFSDNVMILETIKKKAEGVSVIMPASSNQEALQLYDAGATYIILPFDLWASHTSRLLQQINFDINQFLQIKPSHIEELKNRHAELLIEGLRKK